MKPAMEQRLRRHRSRLVVRAWEYRQRRHAHGAWYRLRRVLTDASAAYVVSAADTRQLIEEGRRSEAVGGEFEPPKVILFAPAERVARLPDARQVPVRLAGELLLAEHLVLVPFVTGPPG